MSLLWRCSTFDALNLPNKLKSIVGELLDILNRDVEGFNGDIHTVPREKLKSFLTHLDDLEYGARFILQCGVTSSLFVQYATSSDFGESLNNNALQRLEAEIQSCPTSGWFNDSRISEFELKEEFWEAYFDMDERVLPLVLVTAHWAKRRGLVGGDTAVISMVAWHVIVVFFLQNCNPPVLPVLDSADSPYATSSTDIRNNRTLAELFFQFFDFYGTIPTSLGQRDEQQGALSGPFNFLQSVISIVKTSRDSAVALRQRAPGWRMCVQDPAQCAQDLACTVHSHQDQERILNELHRAYSILHRYLGVVDASSPSSVSTSSSAKSKSCWEEVCRPEKDQAAPTSCFVEAEQYIHVPISCLTAAIPMQEPHSECPPCSARDSEWNGEGLQETVLSWKVDDIKNSNLCGLDCAIPDVFSDASRWFEAFPIFVIEELRAQLEQAVTKKIGDVVCCFGVELETKHPIAYDELISPLLWIPHAHFKNRDDCEEKCSYSYALLVKSTSASLTPMQLQDTPHVLISIGRTEGKLANKRPEMTSFAVKVLRSPLIEPFLICRETYVPCSGWQLLVLGVHSIAPSRIYNALVAGNSPPFMEDIISGQCTQLPALYDSFQHSAVELADCSLNPAQIKAVEKVARACGDSCDVPRIQLIKGPPGTGKTSTLVQLLRALVKRSLIVHATAPTNTAVCELARRFVSNAAAVCNSWAHSQAPERAEENRTGATTLCLADVVLVGTANRLKFSGEEDILRRTVLDARVKRILQVTQDFPVLQTKLDGFVALHENMLLKAFSPTSTDQPLLEQEEDKAQTAISAEYLDHLPEIAVQKHFRDLIAELRTSLDVLIREAPAAILKAGLHKQAREELISLLKEAALYTGAQLKKWMACSYEHQQDTLLPFPSDVAGMHKVLTLLVQSLRGVLLKPLFSFGELRNEIVRAAQVVFSTVNVCGNRAVFRQVLNDVVIIDEATQLVQAETAIVLHQNLKCAVLVGDDKQLPSTVISKTGKDLGYGQSLFDRLIQHGYPYSLLDTQYRMHPHISRWPRIQFYNGDVVDGENVRSSVYEKPWHDEFPPLQLCHVRGGREQTSETGSKFNQHEVIVVRQMLLALRGHLRASGVLASSHWSVGLVSPYAAQVEELSKLCSDGCEDGLEIRASTVDGFQGQECDFILFSAVRSNPAGNIGFLKDERRLNVAITRARYGLVIICNADTVSSNATWKGLVEHTRDFNAFADSNTGGTTTRALLSKAAILWDKQEFSNRALIEPTSSIFEHCPWKIVFSADFKANLTKSDSAKRNAIIQVILKLAEGKWPKFMLTDKPVSSLFQQSIFVLPIQGRKSTALLWSVDVHRDVRSAVQYIKLWGLVNTATADLSNAVRRVENGMRQYSAQYRNFCIPQERDAHQNAILPLKWEGGALSGVMWHVPPAESDCGSDGKGSTGQSNVKDSVHLAKFYPLTSNVARSLSTASNVANIELPFEMSEEEEAIVRHDGSVVVLGRSGTGKTTVILHRMLAVSKVCRQKQEQLLLSSNAAELSPCRQMLLTTSPVLCKAIKRAYDTMTSTANALSAPASNLSYATDKSSSSGSVGVVVLPFDDDRDNARITTMTLQSIPSSAFPLIITYSDFLRMLDRTLSEPFFTSSGAVSRLGRGEEVCFDRFQHIYYPAFSDKLRKAVSASALYLEIFTHIKGSIGALANSRLSLEQYLALGTSRSVAGGVLCRPDIRKIVYEAFLRYEAKKKEQQEYDALDVVHHAYQQLTHSPYEGPRMDAVYVDEVQDLTSAQIALLKFVTASSKGYLFAGDTAQTIAHGVGFRFEAVKDIFHNEFLGRDGSQKALNRASAAGAAKEEDEQMPAMWQLCRNFRTHSGVVKLANSVVEQVLRFFPLSIDRMDPEYSQVTGPRPIILESAYDIVTELFQSKTGGGALQFGAEQVILVRDEETKRQLTTIAGRNALVLTVLEAKGMEFTDCLIYNFFKSSPLTKEWRVLYSADNSWDKARTEFDPSRHGALCTELKLLYVLLTRARQHLLLFDEDKASREPMLHLWRKASLVEQRPLDEDLKSLFRCDSTQEQWKDHGEQFFERKQFANARICFQRARNDFGERLCDAAEQEQSAERSVDIKLAAPLFAKAAAMFVDLDRSSAARCYERAGELACAARYYKELGQYSEAARCFTIAKRWADAAQMHRQASELQPCLACCYEGHLYDLALTLLQGWAVPTEDASVGIDTLVERKRECIKTAALHFHTQDKEEDMMRFVNMFPDTEEKRRFLRRYGHLHRLLETELADGCFLEAARIHENLFDFESAADCYDRIDLPAEALGCTLKHVRRASLLSDDYLPGAMTKAHAGALQARVNRVNQPVKNASTLTVTADQRNAVERLLLEVEMLQQLPGWDDPAVLRALFEKAKALPSSTAGGLVAFSPESSWRLRLQIARQGFALALKRGHLKEGAFYFAELTAVIDEVVLVLSGFCTGRLPSQTDAKTLFSCMILFEFSWDMPAGARMVVPRILKAPYTISGLQSVFGLVHPTQSSQSAVAYLTMLDFSQRALKFCQTLIDNADMALDTALLGSQDVLLQKATNARNLSVQQFVTALKGGQPKAPLAYSSPEKLALLEALCQELALMKQDDAVAKGGPKGKGESLRVMLLAVEIAAPHIPNLEEMGAVVRARRNADIQGLVGAHHAKTFQQPGLKFQRIAQSLLLSVLAGSVTTATARLMDVLKYEFKKAKIADNIAAVDTRSLLVGAFHWEHTMESGPDKCATMPHGTLLYGASTGLSAVVWDANFGALNKVAFQLDATLPVSVKDAHGCYSAMVLIKLLERYFVLFLLHFKSFRDVLLPGKLAQDVLCVQNSAFCSILSSYRTKNGPAALTNEQRRERQALGHTYLMEIKTLLLNIMFELKEPGWRNWQSCTANMESNSLQQCTPHFFWQRLVVLVATLLVNLAPGNKTRATICRNLKDYGKRTTSLMTAEILELVRSLGSDRNNPSDVLAKFCAKADDPLVLLHCDPHCGALPGYANSLRLDRRFLVESTDAAGFVEFLELDQAQLRVATAAGKASEEEEEEVPVLGDADGDELEAQGQSMFATGVALETVQAVPALVEEESEQTKLERKLGSLCETLRRRAQEARERIRNMDPEGALVRLLERECADAGIPRTAALVVQYRARVLPTLLALQRESAHIEAFILTEASGQQGASALQKRDRALDLQGVLEDTVALLTPRGPELQPMHVAGSAEREKELQEFLHVLEGTGRKVLQEMEQWKAA